MGPLQKSLMRLATVFALLGLPCAAMADAAVTATLSSGTTPAGMPVELQVEVTDAREARVPNEVPVDGLEIVHAGQSTQFQLLNGKFSARTVHTYRVTGEREGTFTIPEIIVESGGKKLRTSPLTLKVGPAASGTTQGGGRAPGGGNELRDMLFADLVVPKTSAYVGELVPAELRIFVLNDGRIRPQAEAGPSVQADGFTQKPFVRAREVDQEVKGRSYRVTVFQTHLTPAKAGSLEIGPGGLPVQVQVASPARAVDPFFDDDFFRNPFQRFQQQRVQIQSGTSKLEVKPLPSAGRPDSFTGAVGQFEARMEASPRSANVGDPITVKLTVSGRGDFDRVQAPDLGKLPGWKVYPPTSKFSADGDAQTGGTKEFEFVLVPEAAHRTTPELEFSYFNPDTGEYVRIPLPPVALTLTGSAPPAAHTVPATATAPRATPTPPASSTPASSEPSAKGVEILDILREPGPVARLDVKPLLESRGFLAANVTLAAGFAAFLGWAVGRRLRRSPDQQRARELQRIRDRGLARLGKATGAERLDLAVEILTAAARLKGRPLATPPDADTIGQALSAREEDRSWIGELVRTRDRMRYAGGSAADTSALQGLEDRIHALVQS